jgi:hypothetical protein
MAVHRARLRLGITRSEAIYNELGLAEKVADHGDIGKSDDDRCTTTAYARDTGKWPMNLPSRVESASVPCGTPPVFPQGALSDTVNSYDGNGNLTKIQVARERPAGDPVYLTASTAEYDVHGRSTSTTDPLGRTSRTKYVPATGGPVTQVVSTSPKGNEIGNRVPYDGSGRPRRPRPAGKTAHRHAVRLAGPGLEDDPAVLQRRGRGLGPVGRGRDEPDPVPEADPAAAGPSSARHQPARRHRPDRRVRPPGKPSTPSRASLSWLSVPGVAVKASNGALRIRFSLVVRSDVWCLWWRPPQWH